MDFYIGVDHDIRRAMECVHEACLTSRYVYLPHEVHITIRQVLLNDVVALHIKARPYVLDTRYEKAFETDVHLRVLEAFASNDIAPPSVLLRHLDTKTSKRAPRAA
jgi:hypothetical protein